jgi:RNA polymerase-binding transcription factor DksA
MVKVKPSKDRERDKERDKDKSKDRERDSHKNRDSKDKEHKDKDKEHKANGKPAKELFKSPFSSDDLAKWRQLLLSRRAEISNDIDGLVKDAMEAEDGHTTPNHIAERGSDADLQDMSLGVAGEEKEVLWQIDRALRKIQLSHPLPYGLCEYTKTAIPRTRLQLIPWTPLSIEGATHMEQNNLTIEDVLHDE